MTKSLDPSLPRTYGVMPSEKRPLLDFIRDSLHAAGCRITYESEPNRAPFRFTFETRDGERMGIVVYAFLANSRVTKNRPPDEHRFQVKYGTRDGALHEIWHDPFHLYTTLFVGIDPERGIFVGIDPVLHNPTKHFISVEFKRHHVDEILASGWHSWERERLKSDEPVEVMVGGTRESFLRYIRFERDALGEDQGHRGLLAERQPRQYSVLTSSLFDTNPAPLLPSQDRLHALTRELDLSEAEVLELIERAPRLKMAVRGWVAEEHLRRSLVRVNGVTDCEGRHEEGGPDIGLRYRGRAITVECKNVLRKTSASGQPRVDFQRTRASKADPCSRYYQAGDFDVVAACLHAVTERWEFRYVLPAELDAHRKCLGRIASNVIVDQRWADDPAGLFDRLVG